MRLKKLIIICVVLILMAGSFYMGYGVRMLQADGTDGYAWQVFSQVLGLVKNHFVDKTDDSKMMYGAVEGMLKTLNDPYTRFMDPSRFKDMREEQEGHFDGVGMVVGLREEKLIVVSPISGSPADKVGIKSEDQIIRIDGKSTEGMGLEAAVSRIRGKAGTAVTLSILRKDWKEPKDFKVIRSVIQLKSVDSRIMDGNIGYAYLKIFNEKSLPELEAALTEMEKKGMKALVLDMRNNPGGLLNVAVDITGLFMQDGMVVSIKERGKQRNAYMINRYSDRRSVQYIEDCDGKRRVTETRSLEVGYTGIPMVILINEGSASASEIVSGALQDAGRSMVIGTRSFGKGSVQSVFPLPDGSGLAVTTAKYQTPKGRDVSRDKIVPDIEVKLTEDDIKNSRDVQLNRALEWLKTKIELKKVG